MSRRSDRTRGFSLAEAMVSLTLLVVVMVVALTLLFTMRSFAERVQWVIEPRQTARRAVDYLSFYLLGATDEAVGAPNAIVTYYNRDASKPSDPTNRVQATYDNLQGDEFGNSEVVPGEQTKFGDVGTDIISLILPTGNPAKYPVAPLWPGYKPSPNDFYIGFRGGCGAANPDTANMDAFKLLTRENGTGHSNALLLLQDNNFSWQYFQINAYVASNCADTTGQNIQVKADPGEAPPLGPIDPPGGHTPSFADPIFLVTGLDAFSFRVRTDANGVPNLEQKNGLFDPNTDNPGAAFVPVIENVEDFQIAYLYADGSFWNTSTQTLVFDSGVYPGCGKCNVPYQAGLNAVAPAQDITQVLGLRVSVVARSRPITFGARQISGARTGAAVGAIDRRFRPAAENRAGAAKYDDFEHYRATVTLMLRARMLGS
jgi:hypothetical protein